MKPGYRVAGRFEIQHHVTSGGMGSVYRALDLETGQVVALKVLKNWQPEDAARFRREAWVLAELKHPGIVRYVAQGVDPQTDLPYLVMEWLVGEDLDDRLHRGELSLAETVALGHKVAESLAAVHAQGLVHRDIKPQNLFLVGDGVEAVKIIDFGIARRRDHTQALTRTGTAIGTPGYMAPEQARGEPDVDARADVFSLGCVLFRCLTGQPAFQGDHVIAILAKVLLEEAPRVSELFPSVPDALDALVARMLSKRREARPADAGAVARELAALSLTDLDIAARSAPMKPASSLTGGEQRLVSVLLVGAPDDERLPSPVAETVQIDDEILAKVRDSGLDGTLREVLGDHGAACDRLADGTRVALLMGQGPAVDQAASAARSALAVRAALPSLPIALAMGRGRMSGRWPMGDLIDRAAILLRRARERRITATSGVSIDELTAGLLGDRFEVEADRWALLLKRELQASAYRRTLLGKPTAFVGRERELRALEDLFEGCINDPAPSAVLVTADPGVGKSRLVQELLTRIRARGDPTEIWIGRGDPMRAGAPFGLLAQAIKATARISDGEPLEQRQNKLIARVGRHVDPAIQRRVTEFLGVMVGTPFPDDDSVQLRAAKRDAMLLGDQMRRAWVDFVRAECRAGPVVLVLEDLHWGDSPTVELVDTALRLLDEQPLMVVALARPAVQDLFPNLWRERRVTFLRLGELPRRACERLAQQVLGSAAAPATIATLWARSAGNAFFLEELLRAIAEGRGDGVPNTVLAMVQSRLEALSPDERKVLRAGSVLGEVFWRGSVTALLGARAGAIDEALASLERGEWITARPAARFHGEKEYVFRHALVRGAAYGMLTDEDRPLGHQLAGKWLEAVGELDAMVLAEHFDRGGEPAAAAQHYRRAAEQALSGNDLQAAIDRAERALTAGLTGEALGEVALVRAEAHRWLGENTEAERWALKALDALPRRDPRWYRAVSELSVAASRLVHRDRLTWVTEMLLSSWSGESATAPEVLAMAEAAAQAMYAGAHAEATALQEKIEAVAGLFDGDEVVIACIRFASAGQRLRHGDISSHRVLTREVIRCFERAGDARKACAQRANESYAASELGDYEEAAKILQAAVEEAERLGLRYLAAHAKTNLGLALARVGSLAEARAVESAAIEYFMDHPSQLMEAGARIYLSVILKLCGDLEGAEAEARRALNVCGVASPLEADAQARLADVLFARGQVAEALECARRAIDLIGSTPLVAEGAAFARLVFAEVLDASGAHAEAREVIATARAQILRRAARISDPIWRQSFLSRVPEHARTLALAEAWLGDGGAPPTLTGT